MKPQYLSLAQIFGPPVRFVVPLFQRPYVWNEEAQWAPLWEDIATVADRVLAAAPGAPVRGHFLGSVVLDQKHTGTGSVEQRSVIDGQQRLTTLQILLKASAFALLQAKEKAAAKDAKQDANQITLAWQQLGSLTANPVYAVGEESYKVWPTNDDRAPFRAVMDDDGAAALPLQGRIPDAYRFFRDAVASWLEEAPVGPRALALAATLLHHLRVIVLDLEPVDEPQAIFETLNTGGAPLLPADLIKNWLLWEASRNGLGEAAVATLYTSHWQDFDRDGGYWRTKVGTGHASRPRIDGFLTSWLTERTLEVVGSGHIYDVFLDHVDGRGRPTDVPALMQEIHHAAGLYRQVDQPPSAAKDRFGQFLERLKILELVVLQPLLLHLLQRSGSDQADRDRVAAVLESFLVRRLVCSLNTRGYGKLFIDLLKAVAKVPAGDPASPAVEAFLSGGTSGSTRWPDDAAFERSWRDAQLYFTMRQNRLVMILRALEEELWRRDPKALPIVQFAWPDMQIEHVMPRGWRTPAWPLPSGGDESTRDATLQTIGNLTLISAPLNPSISNGPWSSKREALSNHAQQLRLNQGLLAAAEWSEAAIAKRSAELFTVAKAIWPGPSVTGAQQLSLAEAMA